MPIDVKKALGKSLPPLEYEWNEDTMMLYALGSGVAIDESQTSPQVLQYTYENGLKALPTFGVVPCFPVLMHLGQRLTRMGEVGAGQVTKVCNQMLVACNALVIAEVVARAGVNPADISVLLVHLEREKSTAF